MSHGRRGPVLDDMGLESKKAPAKKTTTSGAEAAGGSDTMGDIAIVEHQMTVAETEAKHRTSVARGLSDADVATRFAEWGPNSLTPPPVIPWYIKLFKELTGFFSLLLWTAAVLCFIGYGLTEDKAASPENLYLGFVLTLVVLITSVFSYYQGAQSEAVMEGFKKFLPQTCTVRRNGLVLSVDATTLVPGDIVLVSSGEKVPADIRVCEFGNFKVDNSSLTGESLAVKRTTENHETNPLEATNVAFYGTMCVDGNATGIVIATGDRTVIGTIAGLASATNTTPTPIKIEIDHFIKIVSAVAVTLGVVFVIIGFGLGADFVTNIVYGIGIIVANVPEGLLVTVTVALTLTAKQMGAKQVLVKNLESVETLGSTTVIASDKTGTLTQNRMTVAHCFYNNQVLLGHGDGPSSYKASDPTFRQLQLAATLCTNAVFIDSPENLARPVIMRATKGDASETAMIKFCEPITPILELRRRHPRVGEMPFNSTNKFHVTVHAMDNNFRAPRRVYLKGAPERVWMRCSHVLVNGQPVPKDECTAAYEQALKSLMSGGERVLGFCFRDLPADQYPEGFVYDAEEANYPIEEGYCFLGCLALIDPPRPAVPRAVRLCQQAGIKVIMVTGDHPDTAEAIAKQVHIIRDKTLRDLAMERNVPMDQVDPNDPEIKAMVVTGAMLSNMSDLDLDRVLDFDQIVFARTSPKQKLIIVKGLQNKKYIHHGVEKPVRVRHVVAVTGDGVNDSPALKAADIGIAMGLTGSDVAKEAADMILLNDNFASIVDGVEEGRLIFDNLKKSIAYTLTSNIPEITPFLAFVVVGIPLPLSTVLILAIDLGTDMVPAIALAYEEKEADIMHKPPRDMNTDRLVTAKMISWSYIQVGMIQAFAGFFTYFVVLNDYGFPPSILPYAATVFDDFHSGERVVQQVNGTWWLGKPNDLTGGLQLGECTFNIDACRNPSLALRHAQTAFFLSIIIVQWAGLLSAKTRTLSMKHQGMNNRLLNFGLFSETFIGFVLAYTPALNVGLRTAPIMFVHWLPALPFSMFIFLYDEVRKWLCRNLGPKNWFIEFTYY